MDSKTSVCGNSNWKRGASPNIYAGNDISAVSGLLLTAIIPPARIIRQPKLAKND